ncbi:EmrB/QacA subfamily drug resistance transporter [Actinomadura coerulea]|uniref:EmrB/QacA subfamily drug resistance transporter n=1 Tax=Actinomadura coerulea TaxID=46159 RepID=A0A7X0FV01_9ACTN|nr:MFS transporter [Actinomadura coerulea]MBB6394198.1 EmrB/QacA subfamily drug resistance transporter [Actinomadura coerulea]GGQ20901.1 MFS transporter [Actinomadura coerulea]
MAHGSSTHHHAPASAAPPDPRRWTALALISVAQFMLILDVTVVNVALPDIGTDLALSRTGLTWAVTAYTLFFGGLMLLGGRLADTFGARRTMLVGLSVFTTASLATGLAQNEALLLGGRIAQGVGAALLSPAALSTVATTFHGSERNKALGIWGALGGAGFASGVLLGGVLTAGPGWRWVFFVNVPVGLVLLGTLPMVVRGHSARPSGQRLDLLGAGTVTAATAAFIYGMINAGDDGWSAAGTLVPLAAAVLLYGAFGWIERAVKAPLMHVTMLARRPVAAGAFLMLVASGLLISLFFLGSQYLQHARDISALETGLLFLPAALGTGVGAHVAGRLVGSLGTRPVAAAGLALVAAGAGLLTGLSADGRVGLELLPGIVIAAAGVGPVFVAASTSALAHVEHSEAGLASGVINTFHELGAAIGVAVASTIAATGLADVPSIDGFTTAFTVFAVTAAAAALVSLWLVPPGKPQMTVGPHAH